MEMRLPDYHMDLFEGYGFFISEKCFMVFHHKSSTILVWENGELEKV